MSVSSAMVTRLERLGDRFNPIVVKEVRQALKSRQFVVTFLLLLLAAWAGSIFGVSVSGRVDRLRVVGRDVLCGISVRSVRGDVGHRSVLDVSQHCRRADRDNA